MDILDKQQRSEMMSAIKQKDTKPELRIRKLLFAHGYRYRVHKKELAGTPDIVLRKYKLCIFVNGCYWHRHNSCRLAYTPKSRTKFWKAKFDQNVSRDNKNYAHLISDGWRILVIWECAIRYLPSDLLAKLLFDSIKTMATHQEITFIP